MALSTFLPRTSTKDGKTVRGEAFAVTIGKVSLKDRCKIGLAMQVA